MGKWAGHQNLTSEFVADRLLCLEAVPEMFLDAARRQGYHPKSDTVDLHWEQYTKVSAATENAACGVHVVRAGDWRVRGVVEVEENQEIPQ